MADRRGTSAGAESPGTAGENRRGITPAVSKTLEVGIVVLFVALLTTVLFGSVVPDYRATAGAELGDRVLATAVQEIERAVPPATGAVDGRRSVDLPPTISGSGYELRVDGRDLVLDHPDDHAGGRMTVALPKHVDGIEGQWESGAETVVHVNGSDAGVVVTLTEANG